MFGRWNIDIDGRLGETFCTHARPHVLVDVVVADGKVTYVFLLFFQLFCIKDAFALKIPDNDESVECVPPSLSKEDVQSADIPLGLISVHFETEVFLIFQINRFHARHFLAALPCQSVVIL